MHNRIKNDQEFINFIIFRNQKFTLVSESVLMAHTNIVYSAKWILQSSTEDQLTIITASADKSIRVWKYDESNDLWTKTVVF